MVIQFISSIRMEENFQRKMLDQFQLRNCLFLHLFVNLSNGCISKKCRFISCIFKALNSRRGGVLNQGYREMLLKDIFFHSYNYKIPYKLGGSLFLLVFTSPCLLVIEQFDCLIIYLQFWPLIGTLILCQLNRQTCFRPFSGYHQGAF